jgi:hypothetical protein
MGKGIAIVAALSVLLCGCSQSPEKVFTKLKAAVLDRDVGVVWDGLTPETQALLAERCGVDLAGASDAQVKTAAYEYLSQLIRLLTDRELERVRMLKFGKVNETADTAIMSLVLGRSQSVDQTLVFRKVDGKWLWDARDVYKWYMANSADFATLGDL